MRTQLLVEIECNGIYCGLACPYSLDDDCMLDGRWENGEWLGTTRFVKYKGSYTLVLRTDFCLAAQEKAEGRKP